MGGIPSHINCPECGRLVKYGRIRDHMRQAHDMISVVFNTYALWIPGFFVKSYVDAKTGEKVKLSRSEEGDE